MKRYTIYKWIILIIALAVNVFILVNSFIPGDASAATSNSFAETAAKIVNDFKPGTVTNDNFEEFAYTTRKVIGHFCLFGASGIFSSWAFYLFLKNTKVGYFMYQGLISFMFGFLIAAFSELIQSFTDGRTGSWVDIGIDSGGYFVGLLLVILILLIVKSPIFHKSKLNENQAQ